MTRGRAGIFEGEGDFDISGFAAKPPAQQAPAIPAEQVRAVSEQANFRSREPRPPAVTVPPPEPARREPRRYRTGRNIQLNIKVRADTLERFYALADRQGWVLGEALEHAVDALDRELSGQK